MPTRERTFMKLCSDHERELRAKYGTLLTLEDVTEVLRYPSRHAARKARSRGSLPVEMIKLPQRRKWLAPVRPMAEYLAGIDLELQERRERP